MEVGALSGTASGAPNATARGTNTMGKDDFLKLLLAQMRYQNPLEPAKDMEFMGQLAQFTSLEQLDSIRAEIGTLNQRLEAMLGGMREQSLSAALNLVGRMVRVETPEGKELAGSVTGVRLKDGEPYLLLAEAEAALSWLREVGPQVAAEGGEEAASTAP